MAHIHLKIHPKFFPELHFGANIYVEKLNKIFFRIKATVTYNIASYTLSGTNNPTSSYSNTTKIKDFSVGINPQLLYSFNKIDAGNFYVGIGLAAYAVQSTYNNVQYNSYTAGGALLTAGSETDNTSLITLAATLKFGYTVSKKVDVYLGYNARLSTVNNTEYITYNTPNYISDQSVFKLGVNYSLVKGKCPGLSRLSHLSQSNKKWDKRDKWDSILHNNYIIN